MGASVVSCCDAPPILDASEQVLDLVALSVEPFVVGQRHAAASRGGNAGLDPPFAQGRPEAVAVITSVADEISGGRKPVEHQVRTLVIAHLAFCEQHDQGAAGAVADDVKLGVQAAFRPTKTAGKSPFLSRLAAVRCAFRCVVSIINRSVWPALPARPEKI